MPMPPDVYADHLRRRQQAPRPDPLHPVPRRAPAGATSELARELLDEAADRGLESGEILLVSEEATLADLEEAAAAVAPAGEAPAVPDDPVVAVLAAPRLLSPRVWEIMGWQPPLAEHLRLLEAALLEGRCLPQTLVVGHVETFVERVEHVMRLRHLAGNAAAAGGRIVLDVRQVVPAELPPASPMLTRVLEGARPADEATDLRHARAVARLALGAGVVLD
jgi:hypothetical protein